MSIRDYGTTTIVEMDAASKALVEAPPNDDRTWAAGPIPVVSRLPHYTTVGEADPQ